MREYFLKMLTHSYSITIMKNGKFCWINRGWVKRDQPSSNLICADTLVLSLIEAKEQVLSMSVDHDKMPGWPLGVQFAIDHIAAMDRVSKKQLSHIIILMTETRGRHDSNKK